MAITGFDGLLIEPDNNEYESARSVWNGDIDRKPALVARCSTAADVAAVIRYARDGGLDLTVRGGGHSYAGHAIADGAVMLDLSGMQGVSVDPATKRAIAAGGATWADLDGATAQHALAVTGGFISHTGVGGLTLGGGMGWLTRKCGLSCDNLTAAEVVTADGRILRASDDENGDLFWALRGGGGNFGVVTSFEFRLYDHNPLANLGMFFWTPEHGAEALRFAREFVKALPDGMGALIAGLSAPPMPFVPEQYHFTPGFALAIGGWGSAEDHARVVAPIRDAVEPAWELVTPIPYTELQKMFNESAPWGLLAYEKALYLQNLDDAVVDSFVAAMPKVTSPMTFCPVFPLDGAFHDTPEDATAFGGGRDAGWVFNMSAGAMAPDVLDVERTWVRALWDELRPNARDSGGYVNFLADADEERVRASYGAKKYDRLAQIKREYDPDNLFSHNANIKPAP
ncbi:MAG TPA: FAD-binding oxidoreductase [Acidimicrobiales bacterium]|nr:FAD-binding oxidoreductase [Acidimicrobiales bacterium]